MDKARVSLYLEGLEVVGDVHLQSRRQRLTDLLNTGSENFIALTNVKIFDREANLVRQEDFICVNKAMVSMARLTG